MEKLCCFHGEQLKIQIKIFLKALCLIPNHVVCEIIQNELKLPFRIFCDTKNVFISTQIEDPISITHLC